MYVCLYRFSFFPLNLHHRLQNVPASLSPRAYSNISHIGWAMFSFICFPLCFLLLRTISSPDCILCHHSPCSLISWSFQTTLLPLYLVSPILQILYPSLLLLYPFFLETYFMKFLIKNLWKGKQTGVFTSHSIFIPLL